MLTQAAGRLDGMTESRLDEIADILDGAEPGATVETLETALEDTIGSAGRALATAMTELTWSLAEGMLGVYYAMGVTETAWLTAKDERVCPLCSGNQAAGYLPIGDPFPSGDTQPPGHVSCRCCLVPGDVGGTRLPYRDA